MAFCYSGRIDVGPINNWDEWLELFKKRTGNLKKPFILIIDEFDKLPSEIIDQFVSMFRDMYLTRDKYLLHGLALGFGAYVQFRGSEFHTRNARSRQLQEQRRAKAVIMIDQTKQKNLPSTKSFNSQTIWKNS